MPNETWDIEDAGYNPEEAEAHARHLQEEHCLRAVEYADRWGIHAVPVSHGTQFYWTPRTSCGHDPALSWLLDAQPTYSGWLSWADAVVAFGHYLEDVEDAIVSDATERGE
jgi:hypothetical protein